MIGYGLWTGALQRLRQVSQFFELGIKPVLKAVCARDESKVQEFALRWGWESAETDWRRLVERPDIDVIDIASPNNTHYESRWRQRRPARSFSCESLWR